MIAYEGSESILDIFCKIIDQFHPDAVGVFRSPKGNH